MQQSVEGIYRNGIVELLEVPSSLKNETQVIVTFPVPATIDLQAHGLSVEDAAELRARLATFAEDWDSPEMDIYDNYDAAKANLSTR